jgi:hypothetical protein
LIGLFQSEDSQEDHPIAVYEPDFTALRFDFAGSEILIPGWKMIFGIGGPEDDMKVKKALITH